jgi:hypothetical protein
MRTIMSLSNEAQQQRRSTMYYILYKKYDTRLSDRPYWKKRLPFEFDSYYDARNWINVCFDGEWYRQSFEPEYHDCYEEEDRNFNICNKIVYQIRKLTPSQIRKLKIRGGE